ncbi:hypothetical protein [Yoonia algicola]|uniref:Uncharacterized protein n=1 Tax=Yoonia algicola TaxID=3137368 RepID=A0AAN0NEP9_9RHOB
MPKRFTDGYFALGLILGISIAAAVGLWVSGYGAGCYLADGNSYSYQPQGIEPNKRCWLIPFLVYGEDTLAQWIMAILTIAAVWMLWRTLDLTRGANEAAVQAAVAALKANEIMHDQGAGYLIIKKIEVQARRLDVLLYATVKNIGKRPVRTGKIKGTLQFVIPLSPQFEFIRLKTEVFVGVVEADQEGYSLIAIPWTDITDQYDIYARYIHNSTVSNVDFDGVISWSDKAKVPNYERHILTPLGRDEVLVESDGPITRLIVGYSGMSISTENRQKPNGNQ